jgi:hypothetical protein
MQRAVDDGWWCWRLCVCYRLFLFLPAKRGLPQKQARQSQAGEPSLSDVGCLPMHCGNHSLCYSSYSLARPPIPRSITSAMR